jgi:hypothetical protein
MQTPPQPRRRTNASPTSAQAAHLLKVRDELICELFNGSYEHPKLTKAELAFVFNITRQLIEHIVKK